MKMKRLLTVILGMIFIFTTATMFSCKKEDDNKGGGEEKTEYPKVNIEDDILERPAHSKTIYVVKSSVKGLTGEKAMTTEEKMLLESVQGIVAQRNAELYVGSAGEKFLKYAKKEYNLTLDDGTSVYYMDANGEEVKKASENTWLKNLGTIVDHYTETGDIKGYVKLKFNKSKYSELENQSNQACTIAGAYQYILVAEQIEETINTACPNVKLGRDISNTQLTQFEVFKECENLLNKNLLIMQAAPRTENLREYGISQKAGFYFYNESDPAAERDYIYSSLNVMANAYGWEQIDETQDGVKIGMTEDPAVNFASQRDVNTFAADWCKNLSIWMSMPKLDQAQKEYKKLASEEEQMHYVSFLYSDGDNIQWTTNNAGFGDGYFLATRADRKEMPFGWTLTPSMAEVAPSTLGYFYENMLDIESFVGSVSGYAYSHPALFSEEALNLFARNTAVMMKKADMDLLAIKGANEKVMSKFLDQEEISGGFVMYGTDDGKAGHIYWDNGKPFVHDRYIFWANSGEGRDPEMIAKRISRLQDLSTDKTQSSCYTFIQVHCWSYKYANVVKLFYDNIDKTKIKVITPAEMIDMITENVEPNNGGYTY